MMKGFSEELQNNILHFWEERMQDREHDGFYGAIDGHNNLLPKANKGIVMHARILWTFSAAYRVLKKDSYLVVAERAFTFINKCFMDKVHGGFFWEIDYLGTPINRKKQVYAQAFVLYAYAEYYKVTLNNDVLDRAIAVFNLIESCKDEYLGGYWEAFTEDWNPIADMRLSDKDENEAKTMNTHLHVLEAYTNLLRIWRDERLVAAQKALVQVFVGKIYCADTGHLQLFFDPTWKTKGSTVSYGHDIEAAWLLWEAVSVLGDQNLTEAVRPVVYRIAEAASEGILSDGSLAYELKDGHLDEERHWWVQAEGVVGYQHMATVFDDDLFRLQAENLWSYIQTQLVDKDNGEWYWSRMPDGTINRQDDKAGFWKCPYHNGRMCLEMIENKDFNL